MGEAGRAGAAPRPLRALARTRALSTCLWEPSQSSFGTQPSPEGKDASWGSQSEPICRDAQFPQPHSGEKPLFRGIPSIQVPKANLLTFGFSCLVLITKSTLLFGCVFF